MNTWYHVTSDSIKKSAWYNNSKYLDVYIKVLDISKGEMNSEILDHLKQELWYGKNKIAIPIKTTLSFYDYIFGLLKPLSFYLPKLGSLGFVEKRRYIEENQQEWTIIGFELKDSYKLIQLSIMRSNGNLLDRNWNSLYTDYDYR